MTMTMQFVVPNYEQQQKNERRDRFIALVRQMDAILQQLPLVPTSATGTSLSETSTSITTTQQQLQQQHNSQQQQQQQLHNNNHYFNNYDNYGSMNTNTNGTMTTTTGHHIRRVLRQLERVFSSVSEVVHDILLHDVMQDDDDDDDDEDEEDGRNDHQEISEDTSSNGSLQHQFALVRNHVVLILMHVPSLAYNNNHKNDINNDGSNFGAAADEESQDLILRLVELSRHLFSALQARLTNSELVHVLEHLLMMVPLRNNSAIATARVQCGNTDTNNDKLDRHNDNGYQASITLAWLQTMNQTWTLTNSITTTTNTRHAPRCSSGTTYDGTNVADVMETIHATETLLDATTSFQVVQYVMPRGIDTIQNETVTTTTLWNSQNGNDYTIRSFDHDVDYQLKFQWRLLVAHAWNELQLHYQKDQHKHEQGQHQQEQDEMHESEKMECSHDECSGPATSFRDWLSVALDPSTEHYLFQAVDYYVHELVSQSLDTLDGVAHAVTMHENQQKLIRRQHADNGYRDYEEHDPAERDNTRENKMSSFISVIRDALRHVHVTSLCLQVMPVSDDKRKSTVSLVKLWKVLSQAFTGTDVLKHDASLDAYCCETLLELTELTSSIIMNDLNNVATSNNNISNASAAEQQPGGGVLNPLINLVPVKLLSLTLLRAIKYPSLLWSCTSYLQLIEWHISISSSREMKHISQIAVLHLGKQQQQQQQRQPNCSGHKPLNVNASQESLNGEGSSSSALVATIDALLQIIGSAPQPQQPSPSQPILQSRFAKTFAHNVDPWDGYFARQMESFAVL